MTPMAARPDSLVSLCLMEEGRIEDELGALVALTARCEARLRYWEILYVLREQNRPLIEAAAERLSGIRNLRIIVVNRSVNFYRGRELAASEAIGDVVVVSAFNEALELDLPALAEQALRSGEIVIARREGLDLSPVHWVLRMLSPYRVASTDLKTIALPRLKLAGILVRHTSAIDLRFEAKRGGDRYVRKVVPFSGRSRDGLIGRRIDLALEIVSSSAPRFLKGYALLSLAVVGLSVCYGIYAVLVYLTSYDVQPGWFSNALVQSGSVGYLALGFSIVALGLARLTEQLGERTRSSIVDEIGNINFFANTEKLNVTGTFSSETTQ